MVYFAMMISRNRSSINTRGKEEEQCTWLAEGFFNQEELAMQIRIGKVTHFFNRINVAVLEVSTELKVGDAILFLGHSTEFSQIVESMEILHRKVLLVPPGSEVAVKVLMPVRSGDVVFRIPIGEIVAQGTG
jgi:hypothetical protein